MNKTSKMHGLDDALKIGECISNEKKISPVWLRVSKSPWDISAKKICGYGRPIKNISISDQMPTEFKRTEHLKRPPDHLQAQLANTTKKPGLEAALVLPGGLNLLSSEAPPHCRHIKKYRYQNQVIMEPQQTGRPNDRVRTKFDVLPGSSRVAHQPTNTQTRSNATGSNVVEQKAPVSRLPPQSPIVKRVRNQPSSQAGGGNVVVINSSRAPDPSIATVRANHGRSTARFAALARTSLQA